ncbi:MAG: hypothetical protein KAG84_07475 [Bacteroidales bacterium]|nr:hypothetical protein [Bacteroidales bacterium]
MKLALTIILSFFINNLFSQVGIEEWREHLPYSKTIAVSEGDNGRIYCATPYSAFYYDRNEDIINRMTTVNGLSDVNISTLAFDKATGNLIIAYENANIDIFKNDIKYNISDIKRKSIVGSKRINKIIFRGDLVYLGCDFGIVVLNPKKKEIKDTYFIGPEGKSIGILDLDYDDSLFYAATSEGIYTADVNSSNLNNYSNWSKDTDIRLPNISYNNIAIHSSGLYINKPGSSFGTDTIFRKNNDKWSTFYGVSNSPTKQIKSFGDTLVFANSYSLEYFYNNMADSFLMYSYGQSNPMPNDVTIDTKGGFWIADNKASLVNSPSNWDYKFYKPSGPAYKDAYSINWGQGQLWVASGGIESNWDNAYARKGIYSFIDQEWVSYTSDNTPVFDTIADIMKVVVNPSNSSEIYIGTWGKGIIKMKDNKTEIVYNTNNSTLTEASNRAGHVAIAGLAFDDDNVLWATNSANATALHFMKPNGVWKALSLAPYVSDEEVGDLIIDDYGQKWIIMPRGNGIIVYNDNRTLDQTGDDRKKKLSNYDNNGKLPHNDVRALAKDKDGNIWVGTAEGVAVFYSPSLVFSGHNFDAQQIYIEQEGISQYLLESEVVTGIAIDGANRKWFTTENAGVFLMSDDASEQIYHFTKDNSPLLSNEIYSIAIDDESGEVYFGTENGIISFRSTATEGSENQESKITIYPNPVRPNYGGPIAIKGLIDNANVKITDTYGNLVYETNAFGGQAIWNGLNLNGERVATGVYLVFVTHEELEDQTAIGKILFVK